MIRRCPALIVVLGAHASLLAWAATHNSVSIDEIGHLPAGLHIWHSGRFDVYRVNPPLTRALAALPLALVSPNVDWHSYAEGLLARPEWSMGQDFVQANSSTWFLYFIYGRFALAPLSLLGALICYCWARDLYGRWAGVGAAALWSFCPNIIAHGATISADAGAAALGVTASYAFWRWLNASTWSSTVIAGLALGLAELAKTTWIVLFPLWPALWLVKRCSTRIAPSRWQASLLQLLVISFVGIMVLNAGYGFTASFLPLRDYRFASHALTGETGSGGNRFLHTPAADLRVPFPKDYITGIDLQKCDFEQARGSYLRGEWRDHGWWCYYLYAALVKTPLGALIIAVLACVVKRRGHVRFGFAEVCLLSPALVVLGLVTLETGAIQHFRYLLPALPLIFVFASRALSDIQTVRWPRQAASGALVYSILSSLSVFPYSMSYFNELAGGPIGGPRHLIGDDIDLGQDAWYLKEWADRHLDAMPLYTALLGPVDTDHYGIRGAVRIDRWTDKADDDLSAVSATRPPPGWYAVSVHYLYQRGERYRYFLKRQPIARIGYSTNIYYVRRQAKEVRED